MSKNKRQRKKKNILVVNTNTNGNIMVPTEHISIMSVQFGVSTNHPKYSQHIPKRSVIKQSSSNLKIFLLLQYLCFITVTWSYFVIAQRRDITTQNSLIFVTIPQ